MLISEAIALEYNRLKVSIDQRFPNRFVDLFPSLTDISINDAVFFVCYTFSSSNYHEVISNLSFYYRLGLTDDEVADIVDIIRPHIEFIKNLK